MVRQLAKFVLYKDTPFNDFQNTVHFKSNDLRDLYFDSNVFQKVVFNHDFNFVRDRLSLNAPVSYANARGVNYLSFIDAREKRRYYAYVMSYQYINENVTRLNLIIDVLMTHTQGKTLNAIDNVNIIREHLTTADYNALLPELRTNGDILKTTTKTYIEQGEMKFTTFYVVFQSSVDLSSDFGTVDKPKLVTSKGVRYDEQTSPVNLYAVALPDFNNLMEALAPYPWISQNIKKVLQIPRTFVDSSDLVDVTMKTGSFKNLKAFKDGGKSINKDLIAPDVPNTITKTITEMCQMYGLDPIQDKHLLRSEYTTTEIYAYDGQRLLLDNAFLDDATGLKFRSMVSIGYVNQIALYPVNYRTSASEKDIHMPATSTTVDSISHARGSFLNDAIIFNNFTELPILIDNYTLSLAKGANQRQLSEDRLITGRVENLVSGEKDIQSAFSDTVSLMGLAMNPTSIIGKFTEEADFYRQQKAQFADLALSSPTITSQSDGQMFQISNNLYGLTAKFSAPSAREWVKIKKYYKMMGYEVNRQGSSLSDVESMSVCNYVQIDGAFTLPAVDVLLNQQLRHLLRLGVRLWHNDGTANPMKQDIMQNKRVL